ncbi:hypothetical protein ACLB2K_008109 [Fragaria x ananassa]
MAVDDVVVGRRRRLGRRRRRLVAGLAKLLIAGNVKQSYFSARVEHANPLGVGYIVKQSKDKPAQLVAACHRCNKGQRVSRIQPLQALEPEMARDSSSSSEQLEDEDVSLSDLPHFIEPDQSHATITKPDSGNVIDAEEEFDFGSSMRGSSFLADTKMCVADELFFKGQILPLRLSDSSFTKLNPAQRLSVLGSESMDRQHSPCYMSGFKSISDGRSSSCSSTRISPNSSRSNSNSSSFTATTNTSIASAKPRVVPVRNQFYTHHSPKPQIQISNGARLENVGSRRSKKSSSIWDFFRLGLVRTPEQDLSKVLRSNSARVNSTRISVSRNSSVNSNNSITLGNNNNTTSTVANGTISDGEKNIVTNTTAALISEKKSRQNFFSGCKCSFNAVASIAVVPNSHVDKKSEAKHEKQADKVAVDLKMKKKKKRKKNNGNKQKQLKQDMLHQRTAEAIQSTGCGADSARHSIVLVMIKV